MPYKFDTNIHGDILLDINGEAANLGYNFTFKFPILSWLYHIQSGRKNIFREIHPSSRCNLEHDLEEDLENAANIRKTLPLTEADFNLQLSLCSLNFFSSGNNRIFYGWTLRESLLVLSLKEETLLSLNPDSNADFIYSYYRFIKGQCPEIIDEVIKRLKKLKINNLYF